MPAKKGKNPTTATKSRKKSVGRSKIDELQKQLGEQLCVEKDIKVEEIWGGESELDKVQKLINDITLNKFDSSPEVALKAADILEDILKSPSWTDAKELTELIKVELKRFSEGLKYEVIPSNIFRHFLKVVREEYHTILDEFDEDVDPFDQEKLAGLKRDSEQSSLLKTNLQNRFEEYKEDIVSSTESIANQSDKLIHDDEVIMTMGKSRTLEQFLLKIKDKNPKIIVVLNDNTDDGQELADFLTEHTELDVTVMYQINIYNMMPKVTKVIFGAQAITGLLELRTQIGMYNICLMAEEMSVPIYALAQLYKYSPLPHKGDDYDDLGDPEAILPKSTGLQDVCEVLNFLYDYIPLSMIKGMINQHGKISPSELDLVLAEDLYNDDECCL